MSNIVYMAKSAWTNLLDTIRSKAGTSASMTVSQAATAVNNIPTGGGDDISPLIDKTISEARGSASKIGSYAFYSCSLLTTAYFPNASIVSAHAFRDCKLLSSLTISPEITTIPDYTFNGCKSLTFDMSMFSSVSNIGASAFAGCSAMTIASFPNVSFIGNYAFYNDVSLTTAFFPSVTSIGAYAFQYCSYLTDISFPEVRYIGGSTFSACHRLTTISFPNASSIYTGAFIKCLNLMSLYLLGSSVCRLGAVGAFTSTPISDYTTSSGAHGSIFVPASLYDQYISASNWSVYSERFVSV